MFFIVLLGFLLRITFLDKPEGLWNDEYVSWFVANTPFLEGFWQTVLKQCHMPLYYLYLKPFAHYSDTVLRMTSVIPGILAIPVMYFAGKEYSKRIGLYTASITAALSFLVYYSQEVRFYSLLFLFSAISLLFTLRYMNNPTKKNLKSWIASNVLILFTHVLGIIYVAFNVLVVMYKTFSKKVLWIFLLLMLIILPLGFNILAMLPSSQWWGNFSYTNILFLFSDFFSPILTNNVNAPPIFFYNKTLAIWLTAPTLIAGIAILRGFEKRFFVIVLGVIATMSALAIWGKIVFITKYSIEILPILILMCASGFVRMKKFGTVLFALFLAFHLASFFTPNYVTKIPRSEGHRIVGEILKHQNSQNVIFTYYEPNRFERYIDLKGKNTHYISKINRFDYVENPAQILDNVAVGQTVSVVFLDSVSFFNEDFVSANKGNKKIPEMFMTFSIIKNSLIKRLNSDFKEFQVAKFGSWAVIKARRFR